MDDKKVNALIEEQMVDMADLTAAGFRPETRCQATQALASLGIWQELRRHRPASSPLPPHTPLPERLPPYPHGMPPTPFNRGRRKGVTEDSG